MSARKVKPSQVPKNQYMQVFVRCRLVRFISVFLDCCYFPGFGLNRKSFFLADL